MKNKKHKNIKDYISPDIALALHQENIIIDADETAAYIYDYDKILKECKKQNCSFTSLIRNSSFKISDFVILDYNTNKNIFSFVCPAYTVEDIMNYSKTKEYAKSKILKNIM